MTTPDLTPDYDTPGTLRPLPAAWRTASLRLAVACWAVPLAVGVAIYLASEVVRATAPAGAVMTPWHGGPPAYRPFTALADAGLLTILVGTAAAPLGLAAVLTFVVTRWSATVDRLHPVVGPAAGVVVLLASNFAVTLLLVGLATR